MTLVHTRRRVLADRESTIYRHTVAHEITLIVRIFAGTYPYLNKRIVCFARDACSHMVATRCFFDCPLQTADVFLSSSVVNPAIIIASGYKLGLTIPISVIPFRSIRMINVSTPERTRRTAYLTIRIERIVGRSSNPRFGCTAVRCRFRGSLPIRSNWLTMIIRPASGIGICSGNIRMGSLSGGSLRVLIRKPRSTPTAVVFGIGGEDRVAFAIKQTITCSLGVNPVAFCQTRTHDAVDHIYRVSGNGVAPTRAVAFAGTFGGHIDYSTGCRQIGVLQRTYIRCAAAGADYIIGAVVVLLIRIAVLIARIDAGVGCYRHITYLTAIQRFITRSGSAHITRRIDEARVVDVVYIGSRQNSLVILLGRRSNQ